MLRTRLLRRASVLLGSTLGLAGCPFAAEYGMPHASFDLDGAVVDDQTGDPIPGIEVGFDGNTASSGPDGSWSMDVEFAYACGPDCTISARDIDGSDNGSFAESSTAFTATQTSAGADSWDEGAWEALSIEISMKPEQPDSGLP